MMSNRKRPCSPCDNSPGSPSPTKKLHTVNETLQSAQFYPAPVSSDEEAKRVRDACDYTIKICMEDAKAGKGQRAVRVYADGIYDMFHNGHARQLMQAKTLLPNTYLIVGVCSEELTLKMKGRTVMTESDRYDSVRHCRYVDELLMDAPWKITDEFLEEYKIDFVAHDDQPYGTRSEEDIYKTLKEREMFLATERTEGVSTTDIIANILRDYDMYVRRNLSKGYTAKQLNVSFMKEKKIILGEKYDRLMDKGKELRKEFIDKGQEIIQKWERNSKEFISSFLEVFGKDGRLITWFQEGTTRMVRAMSPTDPESPAPSHSRTPSPDPFHTNGDDWQTDDGSHLLRDDAS